MPDFLLYRDNHPLIFSSPLFWYMFTFVIICYQFIYQNLRVRNLYLMVFSMYFYYLSGGYFFTLLVFSTLVDYYIGNALHRSQNQTHRKWLILASLVINLGVLAYFKYTYFFVENANQLLGTSWQATDYLAILANYFTGSTLDIHKIVLPVGISFYTFQTLSYSLDIYRRQLEPVKDVWDFAFYVSFFPQLVAGPIVRASDFVPQIYQPYRLSQAEFNRAIFLILNGLFKKVVVSDYVSVNYVDRVFDSPLTYSGFENLMAAYGYAIQIYCDFSGYSDMAIGLALLLGFRLTLNFNSPYKSVNITDFWRRWHISLSSWLRDYLYISLGGNRQGKARTYFNLFMTMLLGGLWHGAAWRFIIWGALHGTALALHKLWMELFPTKKTTWAGNLAAGVLTFHFVVFCWLFFRAKDLATVQQMLAQIAFEFKPHLIGQQVVGYYKVFGIMLVGFVGHWLPGQWKLDLSDRFGLLPDLAKAIVIVFLMLAMFQMVSADSQPFIYFDF
jgi:alginate O-acetyltransferase complex protein AlgI